MVMRSSDRKDIFSEKFVRSRRKEEYPMSQKSESDSVTTTTSAPNQHSPEDSSFSLGGSAVWVGDESGLDITAPEENTADTSSVGSVVGSATLAGSARPRRSTDASSSSSQAHSKEQSYRHIPLRPAYSDSHYRHGIVKDTHFYHTTAAYKDHHIPVKMPLSTFPEEVGDVCFQSH
jgi:hypothetical protein